MKLKSTIQDKKVERDFFDNSALRGMGFGYTCNSYLEKVNKIIMKVFSPTMNILDAGCGDGTFTMLCARRVSEVIACDISTKQLAILHNKKIFNVFSVAGDIESNIFKPEIFDGIFCSGLLHHFPDFFNVLKVLLSYLKSGGSLIILEPNGNNIVWAKFSNFFSNLLHSIFPSTRTVNEHYITYQDFQKCSATLGFKIEVFTLSSIDRSITLSFLLFRNLYRPDRGRSLLDIMIRIRTLLAKIALRLLPRWLSDDTIVLMIQKDKTTFS